MTDPFVFVQRDIEFTCDVIHCDIFQKRYFLTCFVCILLFICYNSPTADRIKFDQFFKGCHQIIHKYILHIKKNDRLNKSVQWFSKIKTRFITAGSLLHKNKYSGWVNRFDVCLVLILSNLHHLIIPSQYKYSPPIKSTFW